MAIYGPQCQKTCLPGYANNKGSDQPAHPDSLIRAFVICSFQGIISRLGTSNISIFKLVSVAKETGLSLASSEIPKTGFVGSWPIWQSIIWVYRQDFATYHIVKQQMLGQACAYEPSHQSLCFSHAQSMEVEESLDEKLDL